MALEWLKTILGDSYTEEIDKKAAEAIGKDFVARKDFNEVNETKKALEKTVKARDGQLEELKKVDAAGMQETIVKLQEANKTAAVEHEAALAQLRLDHTLESYLRDQKVKNPKALRGMLDMEKIKLDGDKLLGIEDQIQAIKASDTYLFADGEPVPGAPNPRPGAPLKPEPRTATDKVVSKVSALFTT